jgi:hypothetical protein
MDCAINNLQTQIPDTSACNSCRLLQSVPHWWGLANSPQICTC